MTFMAIVQWALLLATVPFACYLGILALCSFFVTVSHRFNRGESFLSAKDIKFCFVVPACNEADGILTTLQSLAAIDYPPHLSKIVVIADNCMDDTAALARTSSAAVFERNDPLRRGKGWALAFAFERLLKEDDSDAFVIVDADSIVSRNFLQVFARLLTSGVLAAQAQGTVASAKASPRTALQAIAFAAFNTTRSLARSALGVSCGLRGNGMCITREALQRVPYHAYSIVEDIEYGIHLYRHGIKVVYAHDAVIASFMVAMGEQKASLQRLRWGSGRLTLFKREFLLLLRSAIHNRDAGYFDLAFDLCTPPLTYIAVGSLLGFFLQVLFTLCGYGSPWCLTLWLLAIGALLIYGLTACAYSGLGFALALRTLLYVPKFIVWKMVALFPFRAAKGWETVDRK